MKVLVPVQQIMLVKQKETLRRLLANYTSETRRNVKTQSNVQENPNKDSENLFTKILCIFHFH